jgi:adenylate cyclase class IV
MIEVEAKFRFTGEFDELLSRLRQLRGSQPDVKSQADE